ncbi:MAG: TCP-1/cpn60 chaperonin family protein, partial [Candidatus Hodarchaeales archaeon]
GIHAGVVATCIKRTGQKTCDLLDRFAITIDREIIERQILKRMINSGILKNESEKMGDIILSAAKRSHDSINNSSGVNMENIGFLSKTGDGLSSSYLFDGVIIRRKKPHPNMPTTIQNAKIAVLGSSLDHLSKKATDWDRKFVIETVQQFHEFIKSERSFYRDLVDGLEKIGVSVVFCRKRISDLLISCFAEKNILALNLVSEEEIGRLAKATGAKIMLSSFEIKEEDLGFSPLIEFKNIAEEEMLFINGSKTDGPCSVLIRGFSQSMLDEIEKELKGKIKTMAFLLIDKKVVPGGGAIEIDLSREIYKYSLSFNDRRQLAIRAFAESLEVLPRIIANNSGLNSENALTLLKREHSLGNKNYGILTHRKEIGDVLEEGIIDSVDTKKSVISRASEVAAMIIRTDDVIGVTQPEILEKEQKSKQKEVMMKQDEKTRRLLEKEEELKRIDKEITERFTEYGD